MSSERDRDQRLATGLMASSNSSGGIANIAGMAATSDSSAHVSVPIAVASKGTVATPSAEITIRTDGSPSRAASAAATTTAATATATARGARRVGDDDDMSGDEVLNGCGCIIWHARTHLLDWLVAIALGILAVVITVAIQNHRQLFDPHDPRISYPLLSSTFPNWSLPLISIVLPLVIIVTFAYFSKAPHAHTMMARRQLGRHVYGLLLANALVFAVTQAVKSGTGRPRPNCLALGGYSNGTFTANTLTVNDAFSSFPSGHSSMSCVGMVFLYQFLMAELFATEFSVQRNQVWRSMICLLPWALAIWVMISRITDYWHDPADVIAGGLIGISIGFFVFRAHSALPTPRNLKTGLAGDVPDYTSIPGRGSMERV